MTRRIRGGMLTRSALGLLAGLTLMACGRGEPTSDADRLARGRQLVQQMSTRLAAVNALTTSTTETRDRVRPSGRKDSLALTAVYSMRRPNRFYTKMNGGGGLESWYNGKTITIAHHPEKVFAQAPMPDTIDRTLDALAERYDMALPLGDLFYSSPEKALLSDRPPADTSGVRRSAARPACTWPSRTSASNGSCGCPSRASRCRSASRSCRPTGPASQ